MTEVKISYAELFWNRWREGWGDGVPYYKLSVGQRRELEGAVDVVVQAVREELGTPPPVSRVSAVLEVNGTTGVVSFPGDTWASPVIPGHLVVALDGKETARFTAGRWAGIATADPQADAELRALLDAGEALGGLRDLVARMFAALPMTNGDVVRFVEEARELGVTDPDGSPVGEKNLNVVDDALEDDFGIPGPAEAGEASDRDAAEAGQ